MPSSLIPSSIVVADESSDNLQWVAPTGNSVLAFLSFESAT